MTLSAKYVIRKSTNHSSVIPLLYNAKGIAAVTFLVYEMAGSWQKQSRKMKHEEVANSEATSSAFGFIN
jgi:hypothetical protein